MTPSLKALTALPLIALLTGCVAGGGGGGIDSTTDLEQTINEDLDGDGTITNDQGGESQVSNDG